jgi:RHS repeat-associated protein
VRLEEPNGLGGLQPLADFQYDGLNRRTVKMSYSGGSLGETRHMYYSDQWQVLEERVGTSTTADHQFVWGLRYIDDLVLRDRDTDGNGTLDERLYSLQDANWNVIAICDIAGTAKERFAYTPYGVPAFLTASFVATSDAFAWESLYCGYRYDSVAGLNCVRNRYLHSPLGRWVTCDPVEYQSGSQNLYLYALNNPTRFRDAKGLEVPPYDESEYNQCKKLLAAAVVGGLVKYKCAAQLLYWFLYGKMSGRSVCPESCMQALSNFDLSDAFKDALKRKVVCASDCGMSGSVNCGDTSVSTTANSGDLYYALHAFELKFIGAVCDWSCGSTSGTACCCSASCGAEISAKDTYDFCSSYDPNAKDSFGNNLARCGCIVEDYRKKNNQPANTFEIDCSLGVQTAVKFEYRVDYPKGAC